MSESKSDWKLYICRACGLIYDEQEGDIDSGLAPGTRFEDIPDDWECPLCGVTKSDFELFVRPVVQQDTGIQTRNFANKNQQPGILIVGAGIAGWSMAEQIRQRDPSIPVTMITACEGHIYHKPELSLAIGRGLDKTKLIKETSADAAQRLAINLFTNTYVSGFSSLSKLVRTTRGTFKYENLVLALGAKPYLPKELNPEYCWRVNHLNDWAGLKTKLSKTPARIAVLGAGMVGCELAEDLCVAGHEVSLVYRNKYPLSQLLPEAASERLASALNSRGLKCIAQANLVKVTKAGGEAATYKLSFSNGDALTVDHIVSATGLKVDERIPLMAGLDVSDGIVVEPSTLQTSKENIYALGDCINIEGASCRFISPIAEQAQVIASQILDTEKRTYDHRSPTIRLKVQSCSLVLHGQPQANVAWATTNENEISLQMEQYHQGELISRLEFAIAS